jgi:hypothetical protein
MTSLPLRVSGAIQQWAGSGNEPRVVTAEIQVSPWY